jgi:hypothetical protein
LLAANIWSGTSGRLQIGSDLHFKETTSMG